MRLNKRSLWIGLIGISILLIIYLFLSLIFKPRIDTTAIKESVFIEYPTKYNYRQSVNDCGPYNTAAIVRALKGKDIDSRSFAQEIGWRLPNDYTLPWGLENQLKEHGANIKKPYFNLLTDNEKLLLIQGYLSSGKPIIILGERDGYEHYITLLGFNANTNEYHVYDSFQASSAGESEMTIDENGSFPGNITLTSDELLDFWRGGGKYGIWKWYGLVASL